MTNRYPAFALVAMRDGYGVVLADAGPWDAITISGRDFGADAFELDDAPDGLSVWEGTVEFYTTNTPDDGENLEHESIGEFRDLTDEEWRQLRQHEDPFFERRCAAVDIMGPADEDGDEGETTVPCRNLAVAQGLCHRHLEKFGAV